MNTEPKRQAWRIIYNALSKTFILFDPECHQAIEGPESRPLKRHAWANGADELRCDYDLKLDEP